MSATEYSPRLSIRITEELSHDLNACVPWGLKNPLFTKLAQDIVRITNESGPELFYLYLRGEADLTITRREHGSGGFKKERV